MATIRTEFVASDGWTEVADASDADVFVDNVCLNTIKVAFAAADPTTNEAGHKLTPGQAIPRVAAGKVWVKALKETPGSAVHVSV